MIDPLGKVLIELRDDPLTGGWCSDRVRGEEPMPDTLDADGNVTRRGDARGPGEYVRFVVVSLLGGLRQPRIPVQYPRSNVRLYGVSPQDAMTGYGYASDALHLTGGRTHNNGLHIFQSLDDTGGVPGRDTARPRTARQCSATAARAPPSR